MKLFWRSVATVVVIGINAVHLLRNQGFYQGFVIRDEAVGKEATIRADSSGSMPPPRHLTSLAPFPNEPLMEQFGITVVANDMADIRHCNLESLNASVFQYFRNALLETIAPEINEKYSNQTEAMHSEVSLQALERFAMAKRACDFTRYRPSVPQLANRRNIQRRVQKIPDAAGSSEEARLAFLISAHNDTVQLQKMVEVIHLPQHLILIHLEEGEDEAFCSEVRSTLSYPNVVVLQFGRIVYPTDSLSHVFLQMMRFVHEELHFQYDYLITLGSNAYPLWGAHEMAQWLRSTPPRVRMGIFATKNTTRLADRRARTIGATFQKERVAEASLWHFEPTQNNRAATVPAGMPTLDDFAPKDLWACKFKATSGNTAAFDYKTMDLLLNSSDAMEMLANFRSTGGCCVEESSWAAAVTIAIGVERSAEIAQPGAMWQGWAFGKAMSNAVLHDRNDSLSIDIYDTSAGHFPFGRSVKGIQGVQEELGNAKRRGNLFARKLSSDYPFWVDWIKTNLHAAT
jgi:hypothetical protein